MKAILAGFLTAAALAPPCAAYGFIPPPAPPAPRPVLAAGPSAGPADVEIARRLLDAYTREDGHGLSAMPAEAFDPCLVGGEADLACMRSHLRQWRTETQEVTIAVLVDKDRVGALELTCLGGSPRGEWLDEASQRLVFSVDVDPDATAQRERAETCVGRAFGEYMVP